MKNINSLDTLCGALCYAMGVTAPNCSAEKNPELSAFIDNAFGGEKVDKIIMYNPDAIGEWVFRKYPQIFKQAVDIADIEIPLASVMPSVTPVCFGTMYTGAQPSVHGIQAYVKPVIKIETIFDVLIKAGKKPVIISYGNSSLSNIYLERDMDYFFYDDIEQVNAKAIEVILDKKYDFVVVYNGNYDSVMHKNGPEAFVTLAEARVNAHVYKIINETVKNHYQQFNTLVGFAMDHGCHEIDGDCGAHGLDCDEDINIVHLYKAHKKQK